LCWVWSCFMEVTRGCRGVFYYFVPSTVEDKNTYRTEFIWLHAYLF
jgi:hypothetical protein